MRDHRNSERRGEMKKLARVVLFGGMALLGIAATAAAEEACITCHRTVSPGQVAD